MCFVRELPTMNATIERMTARPSVPLPTKRQQKSDSGHSDSNTLEHVRTLLSDCDYRVFQRLRQVKGS
jgi:hypothetical protein